MCTIYFSPFRNESNSYIEMQKALLRASGFNVQPLNLRALFTGKNFGIFHSRNIIVFHWLEARVFRRSGSGGGSKIDIIGLFTCLFYLGLIMLARAKVVYFVHDHAAHDTKGYQKRFSIMLIRYLTHFSTARVVHDPSYADAYRATYLPHPLYWDTGGIKIDGITHSEHKSTPSDVPRFAILGMIRSYKGIDKILNVWPVGTKLIIRGQGTPEYCDELRQIIKDRHILNDTTFVQGFMSSDEFDLTLSHVDVLILPHLAGTMLVSGAFFEGIGRVKAIIARRTPFIDWVSSQLPGIYAFEQDAEIPAIVAAIQANWATLSANDASAAAQKLFGWQQSCAAYREFFTHL